MWPESKSMFFEKHYRDYKYKKITLEDEEKFLASMDDGHEHAYSYIPELIITKGKRKKRAWIIGGVVLLVVVALVIAAAILLSGSNEKVSFAPEAAAISLEDLLQGRLNSRGFNATWVSGNELFYKDIDGNIVLYNVDTKTTKTLLSNTHPVLINSFEHSLSPDQKYLLVAHDYQKLYRHSYTARYTIVEIKTEATNDLTINGNPSMQLAKWGPVDNSIVFIHQSNVYYSKSATSEAAKITSDGAFGFIYNGVPDWVYEEEVFSSNQAVWFSPDGKKLAFGRFDDRSVHIMTIPFYGEPGSLSSQYTKASQVRYPKPGTPNPSVSLHVVDLLNTSTVRILEAPSELSSKQPILSAVSWATGDIVTAIWMNRVQNEAYIVGYNTNEPYSAEIIKSLKEPSGWLELFTPPMFSKDGSRMILILSQEQEHNLGAYRHITEFTRVKNSNALSITKGTYVVTEILGWNEDKNLIYFQATAEEDPAVQHIYSVSTLTKEKKCLSCNIKATNSKTECLYNTASFSKDYTHYVLNCGGPGVPESVIYTTENKKILLWEDNEELNELVQENLIPTTQRLKFDIADGFQAQVSLKLPPNLDLSGKTKYPMLVNVYGGPDSYQVTEKFNLDWGSYLAANKSIIYALIDGRGSGLKGDKILFSGYRHLGTVEVIDQINVTRQIQETLNYIDSSRTAIWGWSYGGYASGMALANDTQGVFKCGISVAPVTDWTLYDSIYTERFMGLPTIEDNYKGYHAAQLIKQYEGLRGKKYFLIHGTLDDNVHYQQSMLWSKILEQNDILFRQQSYPDEDHGLGSVRPHLYHSLENFLDECFVKDSE